MRRSFYLLALGAPFLLGASLPPARSLPPAETRRGDVTEVNVLDRFLRDSGARRQSAPNQRRTPSSKPKRGALPKPPALANVPLPLPKPTEQAQKAVESSPSEERRPDTPPPAPGSDQARPNLSGGQPNTTEEPATAPAETTRPSGADISDTPPLVEQPGTAGEPARKAEVPKPLAKPGTPAVPGSDSAAEPETGAPQDRNRDDEKPGGTEPGAAGEESPQTEKPSPPPPPPLVEEDPEELKACLADLTAIGTKFEPTDPIDDGNGCGIRHPIDVAEVLPGVSTGGATMRCKTALTMAHWLKQTVQPAMDIAMPGRRIVGIVPGSTYACRLRNGASTGKISEHARGNAFDVAAFKLDNGETIEMKPRDEDSTLEGAFQRTATAGACLHFTTVLSPGSDAAHETHLHLDILERSKGYRYCR